MIKKGWSFPSQCGFTGSAGQTKVRGYMRGGKITGESSKDMIAAPAAMSAGVKTKTAAQLVPGRQTAFRKQDIMRKAGFNKKPLIGR